MSTRPSRPSSSRSVKAALCIVLLGGCQCLPGTDLWLDTVDATSRGGFALERFYHPGWDLTRLGRPDGDQFPNNVVCPAGCRHCRGAKDVPPPQFRIYPQPTLEAGAKESFDDKAGEEPLSDVPLVPPDAVDEVQSPITPPVSVPPAN